MKKLEKRFLEKVNKTDGCWLWTASTRSGYGAIKYNNKVEGAHRISYILYKGEINDGLFVCHTCDNPSCVNPDHLFLGSNSDNMKDAFDKGRLNIPIGRQYKLGSKPINRLLSDNEAKNIRELIKNRGKKTLLNISQEENIPYSTIKDISCGRMYKENRGS